jgi:hypothetical protein
MIWETELCTRRLDPDDRRLHRRYPAGLRLSYLLVRDEGVVHSGSGALRNLSQGGIAFHADRILPRGTTIDLTVRWPLLPRKIRPLDLHVVGRVLRSSRDATAIRTLRYEFRTPGLSLAPPRRGAPDA